MRYKLLLALLLSPLIIVADYNYEVKAQTTGGLTLAWDDTINTTQTGYRLYRKRGQTGTFTAVKSPLSTERTAVDIVPIGQIFCYVITAYLTEDTTTVESPRSNEVCGAVLKAPVTLRIQ